MPAESECPMAMRQKLENSCVPEALSQYIWADISPEKENQKSRRNPERMSAALIQPRGEPANRLRQTIKRSGFIEPSSTAAHHESSKYQTGQKPLPQGVCVQIPAMTRSPAASRPEMMAEACHKTHQASHIRVSQPMQTKQKPLEPSSLPITKLIEAIAYSSGFFDNSDAPFSPGSSESSNSWPKRAMLGQMQSQELFSDPMLLSSETGRSGGRPAQLPWNCSGILWPYCDGCQDDLHASR